VKKKKLAIATLILLAALGAVYFARPASLDVEVATASQGEIARMVSETGHIMPVEERTVFAEGQFTIGQVSAEKGDRVTAGQVIVLGETKDLTLRVSIIEANLSAARARYFAASKLEIPLAIRKAEAEVDGARIEHDRALEHLTDLRKNIGSLSWPLTTYDRSLEDISGLRNVYQLGKIKKEEWTGAIDRYEIASARLRSAEAAVREAIGRGSPESLRTHLAEIDALSFEADSLRHDISKRVVKAPLDGVVVSVAIKPGSVVSPGTALAIIYSHELKIGSEILAQDMPLLSLGQEVLVSGQALGGRVIRGRVSMIGPRASESVSELGLRQRRVAVEIDFAEPLARGILPGYPVDIDIVVSRSKGLKVPSKAVFEIGHQAHVFLVKENRVALRPVKIGIETDDYAEIVSGLAEGDLVVVSPPKDLKAGQRVRYRK
jgi:HlyD family secretion protein